MPRYRYFGELKYYYFLDVDADNKQKSMEIAHELTDRFNIDDDAVTIPLINGHRTIVNVVDEESDIQLMEDENDEKPP